MQRRVELDAEGEDAQMLRALLSKFEGQPLQLEQAVSKVAKMASELAPAAAQAAGEQLYTEPATKQKDREVAAAQGGARRRNRPARKAVLRSN